MRTKLVRGLFSILGGRLTNRFISVISIPIIVRMLGESGYGNYGFALAVLTIAMIPVNGGVFDGIRKYLAKETNSPETQSRVFGFYTKIGLFSALCVAVVVLLFAESGLLHFVGGSYLKLHFYLLSGIIISKQLFSLFRSGLMGLNQEHISESLTVFRKLVFTALAIILLYFQYGVAGILVAHIVSNLFTSVFAIKSLENQLQFGSLFDREITIDRSELLSFNLYTIMLVSLTVSIHSLDIVLVRTLSSSAAAGYYKGAFALFNFVWVASRSVQTVLLQNTPGDISIRGQKSNTISFGKLIRYTILLSGLMAIGLGVLSRKFVPLYFGENFIEMVPALVILLPGIIAFSGVRPLLAIGQSQGELRLLVRILGLVTAVNAVLNVALIPVYGIEGAAVATSLSYSLAFVLCLLKADRFGSSVQSSLRLRQSVMTLVAFALALTIIEELLFLGIYELLLVPPLGLILFLAMGISLNSIDYRDIIEIYTHISDRIPN